MEESQLQHCGPRSLWQGLRMITDYNAPSSRTMNADASLAEELRPLLYSLYTYDCVANSNSNTISKFADDTVVVGLIFNNDEMAYLEEIKNSRARRTIFYWMSSKQGNW